jgi:hypothetical protein
MNSSRRLAWTGVALLALALVAFVTVGPSQQALFAVLAGLLLLVAFLAERARQAEARGDAHGTWDVVLNGVPVGSISGAAYVALKRKVYLDPRNALDQAANVGAAAVAILRKHFVGVPVTLFWGALAIKLGAPDAGASFFNSLAHATRQELAAAAVPILLLYVLCLALVLGGAIVLGADLGFRNRYNDAISERLRRYCKTPAVGEIQLFRPIPGPSQTASTTDTSERNYP